MTHRQIRQILPLAWACAIAAGPFTEAAAEGPQRPTVDMTELRTTAGKALQSEVLVARDVQQTHSVDRNADIVIEFADLQHFEGRIGVRARLRGSTDVELPVDNYMIIGDDRVSREQYSVMPSRSHEARYLVGVIERFNVLWSHYRAFERADDAVRDAAGQTDSDRFGRLLVALRQYEKARRPLADATEKLRADIAELNVRLATQRPTADPSLAPQRRLLAPDDAIVNAYRALDIVTGAVEHDLGEWIPTLEAAGCAASTTPEPPAACTAAADQLKARLGTVPDPLPRGQAPTAAATSMQTVFDDLTRTLRTLLDHELAAMHAKAIASVPQGRVHLSRADIDHDDILEITVTFSPPTAEPTAQTADATTPETRTGEVVVRRVFRVADLGFSFSVKPQFALTADTLTGRYTPRPGALLEFRWRARQRWTDWIIPSVGPVLHALEDDQGAMAIGAGVSTGWLNAMIHLGAGYRLDSSDDPAYFFVAFDFANTAEVFGQYFGASNESSDAGSL